MNSFLKICGMTPYIFHGTKDFIPLEAVFPLPAAPRCHVDAAGRPNWAMVCAPDTGTPRSRQRPSSGRVSRGSASQAKTPACPAGAYARCTCFRPTTLSLDDSSSSTWEPPRHSVSAAWQKFAESISAQFEIIAQSPGYVKRNPGKTFHFPLCIRPYFVHISAKFVSNLQIRLETGAGV